MRTRVGGISATGTPVSISVLVNAARLFTVLLPRIRDFAESARASIRREFHQERVPAGTSVAVAEGLAYHFASDAVLIPAIAALENWWWCGWCMRRLQTLRVACGFCDRPVLRHLGFLLVCPLSVNCQPLAAETRPIAPRHTSGRDRKVLMFRRIYWGFVCWVRLEWESAGVEVLVW